MHQFVDVDLCDLERATRRVSGVLGVLPNGLRIGLEVHPNKGPTIGLGRQAGIIALKAGPFGKVVGQLERPRGVGGVSAHRVGIMG